MGEVRGGRQRRGVVQLPTNTSGLTPAQYPEGESIFVTDSPFPAGNDYPEQANAVVRTSRYAVGNRVRQEFMVSNSGPFPRRYQRASDGSTVWGRWVQIHDQTVGGARNAGTAFRNASQAIPAGTQTRVVWNGGDQDALSDCYFAPGDPNFLQIRRSGLYVFRANIIFDGMTDSAGSYVAAMLHRHSGGGSSNQGVVRIPTAAGRLLLAEVVGMERFVAGDKISCDLEGTNAFNLNGGFYINPFIRGVRISD